MDLLLAIDAGTTSVKAGLFAPDGRCLGIGRCEYQLATPAADRAELDPEIYWASAVKTVREALAQAGPVPGRIRALAVSSQGETLITLDASGRPLYPAIVWLDNRAGAEAASLAERFGPEVYRRTGIPEIVATWSACKVLWLKGNEPAVFSRAAKFLLVQDYLIYRLTGRFVTDGSVSCTTLYYDLAADRWWPELLSAVGLGPERLPDIVPPGTAVGGLRPEAVAELGLGPGTVVVTGGMDQAVGAIGAGNFAPGMVSETTGAALAIQATIDDPLIDASCTVPVYAHSAAGRYLFVPVCPTAGMAFKWLRDTFFADEVQKAAAAGADSYDLLTELAAGVPAGAEGLVMLPHLMGAFSPRPNPAARGSFAGFTLHHGRAHFVRALLEGVAFLLRQNLELIEKAGLAIPEIRSTGGGARSLLWRQIKADVCNRPIVTLATEETGLLGDAILAGVATGIFGSVEAGCGAMVRVAETVYPDAEVAAYGEAYGRFCDLDQRLFDHFRPGSATGS
jgi:xylulokinase